MRMSMSGIVVAAGLCAGLPAARAAAYPSAFLEAFGTGGLSALTLGGGGLAGINGDVQNVAAGGGKIYFQEGVDIFSANPDLTDITLFHTNGVAPTSIAVDAADNVLLEAFGTGGLSALTLGGAGLAGITGDVQNVAAGGGKVYFQEGVDIFSANPDLTDITLLHTNGVAPTSIAVDVVPVPEPGGYLPAAWGVAALLYVRRRNRRTGSA